MRKGGGIMWKILFENLFFIEPQTGCVLIDFFMPVILSQLFYQFAFDFVGNLFRYGFIKSKQAGSMWHWLIRLGLVYITVFVFNFIIANIIWFIVIIIVMIIAWCAITISLHKNT